MIDLSDLLQNSLNSRITTMLLNKMYSSSNRSDNWGTVAVPDSTRRAFTSRMNVDSRVAIQGAQNMDDAAALVSQAQGNVTAIKDKLQEMQKIATEAATKDGLEPSTFASMQESLKKIARDIVAIAKNSSFNGISLLDGKAGLNEDGVIQLQAGNSARDQVLTNFLDSNVAAGTVVDGTGNINMENLEDLMNVSNRATGQAALNLIKDVYARVLSVESQYSYDIKSLNNMSTLLKGQSDILEAAKKNHAEAEDKGQDGNNALMNFLNGSDSGNIISAVS